MATFTIHVRAACGDDVHALEVNSRDTVGSVLHAAAEALQVRPSAITLHHDGELLEDLAVSVTQTTLGEGSEVEAKHNRKFEARRALEELCFGWQEDDLNAVVTLSGFGDDRISAICQLMLHANEDLKQCAWTPLCEAAYMGFLETVKVLSISALDSPEEGQFSPLHYASLKGHLAVVTHLIEMGACVNSKGEDGWTPLQCATNSRTVTNALLRAGAVAP